MFPTGDYSPVAGELWTATYGRMIFLNGSNGGFQDQAANGFMPSDGGMLWLDTCAGADRAVHVNRPAIPTHVQVGAFDLRQTA